MTNEQILNEYNQVVEWINYRVKNPNYIQLQEEYKEWMSDQLEIYKKHYVNNSYYNENPAFKSFQEYTK